MLIFDFFSGTGSATKAFKDAGHRVITFEKDGGFRAKEIVDVMTLTVEGLLEKYGQPDFIWASPPCTSFSVGALSKHWDTKTNPPTPKTEEALLGIKLVLKTRELIFGLKPKYGYLIENPRGMLRNLSIMDGLPRWTITYCQYGDTRQKPTDLWGEVSGWEARPMCASGATCHEAAPKGSKSGTQGLADAKRRAVVAPEISKTLLDAIEQNLDKPIEW